MTNMNWDRVRRGWRAGGYPAGEPVWIEAPDLNRRHRQPERDSSSTRDQRAQPRTRSASGAVSREHLYEIAHRLVEGTRIQVPWHDEAITICSAEVAQKKGRDGLKLVYWREGDPVSHRTWTFFIRNPQLTSEKLPSRDADRTFVQRHIDGRARKLNPPPRRE